MARALVLFAALAASAAAQDATDVLRGIARYAAGAASWRLTGRTLTSVGMRDSRTTLDLAFRATWERPGRLRYEVLGGPKAGLLVCNGAEGWTLLPGKPKTPLPAGSLCPAAPTNWDTLGDDLLDARFDGSGSALVEGRDQPCDRIVAQYSALRGLAPGTPGEMWRGSFRRTLCVDRVRQVILRDEIAGTLTNQRHGPLRFEQTTTYALIERNPQLDDSRFDTGFPLATLTQPPLVRPLPPAGSTAPELIYRREPEYTPEARAAKFQGTATLSIQVGADGVPREPRLVRTLGYGLDLKAVQAVCDWRFRPATENGRAVTRRATVEVAFRLIAE